MGYPPYSDIIFLISFRRINVIDYIKNADMQDMLERKIIMKISHSVYFQNRLGWFLNGGGGGGGGGRGRQNRWGSWYLGLREQPQNVLFREI